MAFRAAPVLYTLVPALVLAAGLHLWLQGELRIDPLWTWLLAVNVVALPVWALDKLFSKRSSAPRVPERTLHLLSVAGAAPAALAAMNVLRHKTKHRQFWWIHIGLLVPWAAVAFFWLSRP